jgi:uncharacterized membrane protein YedE/YeeE
MTTSLAPLLIGVAFGVVLQRSGLSRYDRIANLYRFRDLAVLKVLGSALVTAAIALEVMRLAQVGVTAPIPSTYAWGNMLGGVVFGIGMALSGFCPGTVAAGAGEGRLDYLVPGLAGLFAGAVVYGLFYERVMPILARVAHAETLPQVMHVDAWLAIVLFGEVALLGFLALERRRGRARAGARVGARS